MRGLRVFWHLTSLAISHAGSTNGKLSAKAAVLSECGPNSFSCYPSLIAHVKLMGAQAG